MPIVYRIRVNGGIRPLDQTGSSVTRGELRFDANLKWLFTELPFQRRFEAAAAHGFTAVEIAAPYTYPARSLRQWLADAGLCLVLINSPGGEPGSPTGYGTACHPERVEEFRTGLGRAIEYAAALDAPFVHLMAGIAPDSLPYEFAYSTYLENLSWAAGRVAQTDVTLLVEVINQRDAPGFVLRSLEQAVAAIKTIGSSRVRLMFDIYHCQVIEGTVLTPWHELFPLVSHIQVADTPDRHEPGTGELCWDNLFDGIVARGYAGWIGCEYRPSVDTASSLAWRDRYYATLHSQKRPTS